MKYLLLLILLFWLSSRLAGAHLLDRKNIEPTTIPTTKYIGQSTTTAAIVTTGDSTRATGFPSQPSTSVDATTTKPTSLIPTITSTEISQNNTTAVTKITGIPSHLNLTFQPEDNITTQPTTSPIPTNTSTEIGQSTSAAAKLTTMASTNTTGASYMPNTSEEVGDNVTINPIPTKSEAIEQNNTALLNLTTWTSTTTAGYPSQLNETVQPKDSATTSPIPTTSTEIEQNHTTTANSITSASTITGGYPSQLNVTAKAEDNKATTAPIISPISTTSIGIEQSNTATSTLTTSASATTGGYPSQMNVTARAEDHTAITTPTFSPVLTTSTDIEQNNTASATPTTGASTTTTSYSSQLMNTSVKVEDSIATTKPTESLLPPTSTGIGQNNTGKANLRTSASPITTGYPSQLKTSAQREVNTATTTKPTTTSPIPTKSTAIEQNNTATLNLTTWTSITTAGYPSQLNETAQPEDNTAAATTTSTIGPISTTTLTDIEQNNTATPNLTTRTSTTTAGYPSELSETVRPEDSATTSPIPTTSTEIERNHTTTANLITSPSTITGGYLSQLNVTAQAEDNKATTAPIISQISTTSIGVEQSNTVTSSLTTSASTTTRGYPSQLNVTAQAGDHTAITTPTLSPVLTTSTDIEKNNTASATPTTGASTTTSCYSFQPMNTSVKVEDNIPTTKPTASILPPTSTGIEQSNTGKANLSTSASPSTTGYLSQLKTSAQREVNTATTKSPIPTKSTVIEQNNTGTLNLTTWTSTTTADYPSHLNETARTTTTTAATASTNPVQNTSTYNGQDGTTATHPSTWTNHHYTRTTGLLSHQKTPAEEDDNGTTRPVTTTSTMTPTIKSSNTIQEFQNDESSPFNDAPDLLSYILWFTIVGGVVLVLLALIITCGCVKYRRKRQQVQQPGDSESMSANNGNRQVTADACDVIIPETTFQNTPQTSQEELYQQESIELTPQGQLVRDRPCQKSSAAIYLSDIECDIQEGAEGSPPLEENDQSSPTCNTPPKHPSNPQPTASQTSSIVIKNYVRVKGSKSKTDNGHTQTPSAGTAHDRERDGQVLNQIDPKRNCHNERGRTYRVSDKPPPYRRLPEGFSAPNDKTSDQNISKPDPTSIGLGFTSNEHINTKPTQEAPLNDQNIGQSGGYIFDKVGYPDVVSSSLSNLSRRTSHESLGTIAGSESHESETSHDTLSTSNWETDSSTTHVLVQMPDEYY